MGISPSALYQAVRTDIQRSVEVSGMDFSEFEHLNYYVDSCEADDKFVAMRSLLSSITKKFEPERHDKALSDKATELFLECNESCRDWVPPDHGTMEHAVLLRMQNLAYQDFAEMPDWSEMLTELAPGPGSSIGSKSANSALEKLFFNPVTTTSAELYNEYRRFMRQNTQWFEAEMRRIHHCGDDALSVVRGSRLTHVRKNSEIDRTINVEASLNMLFQKALAKHVDDVLRHRFGYSPKIQPERNRRMARRASLDGKSATIDLTSASDLNSKAVFRYLFPSTLYAAMLDCRSKEVQIGSEWHPLHMMSCMGNGFTFSIMTYVLSLVLFAVAERHGIRPKYVRFPHEKFAVFGDDIICPVELYEDVVKVLRALGHRPNGAKSFSTGPFRESCGIDCYRGSNVRGVYAKSVRTRAEQYSLVNRLNRWSAKWNVPLPDTMALILPKKWRTHVVPIDESDDAGVKVPYEMYRKIHPRSSFYYHALKPRKRLIRLYDKERNLLSRWASNSIGVMLAATVGWVSSSGVARRSEGYRPKRYDVVKLPAPHAMWDRYDWLTSYEVTLRDWRAYSEINFTS